MIAVLALVAGTLQAEEKCASCPLAGTCPAAKPCSAAETCAAGEKCGADFKEPVELFNGESLGGWTFFLVDEGAKMEDVWSVKDGILICKGEPHGFLATEKCYQDFNLVVEWRWAPGKEPGNSGVLMRITGDEMMLPNCVEAQLASGNAGDMYGFQGFKIDGPADRKSETKGHKLGGDLTGLKKLEGAEKEPGEWNRYEITANGDKIVLKVNGKKVNEANGCDVRCGKIGLQSEGGEIHFRKVTLKPVK
jgi:hypothetical protein